MFQSLFIAEVMSVTGDRNLAETMWNNIKKNYNKPGRHYHTLDHLDKMAVELLAVKDAITDWQTIVFSTAYHDIVYNVLKHNNEEKSAVMAMNELSKLSIEKARMVKCHDQILATKKHELSTEPDTNYFTDADLSILGSKADLYLLYTRQVRKEYAFYPDIIYIPGRRKVLLHFLQMPFIFKTPYFIETYESQARVNLTTELNSLA